MTTNKYFDHQHNRQIFVDSDGCDLCDWDRLWGSCQFARHVSGFKIFLAPDRLLVADEYATSDPYSVENNIERPFHRNRISLTIELVREAVSLLSYNPEILDLGCGQGHITEMIRRALPESRLTGLDYSSSAIKYAHEHFPEIDFSVGDIHDAPYAPMFFDVVVCNNVWEHVADPLLLLRKIKRIIKPGGHLVISTPSRYRTQNLVRALRGKPVVLMSRYHVTEYTVGQVGEQLAHEGFSVKKALSRPSGESMKERVVRMVLSKLILVTGSHHQLGSTVFYLAQGNVRRR